MGNAAVKVGHHGSAAEVVGMVEVEGWCRVGCGLWATYINSLPLKPFCFDGAKDCQ
ncbi:MAG: hypothetical protein IKP37_04355 [Paludibacteraceae bacterium]|nr:hypothetical protein [Paludibacteraceae bacterium]